MIKGVLFDMDGLLLDTERLALQAFREAAEKLGLEYRFESFQKLIGLNPIDGQRVFKQVMPEVDIEKFGGVWGSRFEDLMKDTIPVRPFVKEVLSQINSPMVVVTSTRTQDAIAKLQKTGLHHHFTAVIGGDAVTNGKPHPEPYEKGAANLGLNPNECVAFEDSENGTRSAVSAGCVTVQVPDLVPPSQDLRALGHTIAPDIQAGARAVGLIN